MNSGKVAIMSAGNIPASTIWAMEKLKNEGFEVSVVNQEDIPEIKKHNIVEMDLTMDPIILEPCIETGIFSSKHYKDESYYSKRITKRRKKNKNKKTHRK